jgi:hypothetical protein
MRILDPELNDQEVDLLLSQGDFQAHLSGYLVSDSLRIATRLS